MSDNYSPKNKNSWDETPSSSGTRTYYAEEKERGGCLLLWLIVSSAFAVFSLISCAQIFSAINTAGISSFLALLYGGLVILSVMSLYGVWTWKKWGVYGIASVSIFSLILEVMLGIATAVDFVAPFVQLGILYFVVQSRWHYFE